jgi:hypothetical protein
MGKFIKHWLAHRLGWNEGEVATWSMTENIMVGFRCYGCGKLSGVHIAPRHL